MTRIVYLAFPTGAVEGGQKMILRHVETLRTLGFDAVGWRTADNVMPSWMQHSARIETDTPFRPDDILVVPSDAPNALARLARGPYRVVVFCQNQYALAVQGYEAIDEFAPERFPVFITPGVSSADSVRRVFPQARIEVIPCFADERVFRWRGAKRPAIALSPRKRPVEAQVIRTLFRRFHPAHAGLPWMELLDRSEAEVAEAFAHSTLFLSLSRFESVGMTPLEAMASGCLVAGFAGLGGREYATPQNGFWVEEDDCEAAADALAHAAEIARRGGLELATRLEAGQETAAQWSYVRFLEALEAVWMQLAPQARRSAAPLA